MSPARTHVLEVTRATDVATESRRPLLPSRPVAPARPAPRPAPRSLQDALNEPGRAIDIGAIGILEHRFGRPLDHVQVHTGSKAAHAARQAGAEAFTIGNDIVFGEGRYDPSSPSGLELLAHEVAHTVQQEGVGQGPTQARLAMSAPSSTLEREADAAARSVVHGPAVAGMAGGLLNARASGPVLSRRAIDWKDIPSGKVDLDDGQSVKKWDVFSNQVVRFNVPKLMIPMEKGPALKEYQAKVKSAGGGGSGLEATIEFEGKTARAGLWQSRAPTADLNRRWLVKVGWEASEANTKWHAAGGKKGVGFPTANPGVAKSTCQMDHIVELQLGGTNSLSNITPLNASDNRKSGSEIWQTVSGIARTLRPLVAQKGGKVNVILSFQDVDQVGGEVPKPTGCAAPGSDCTCTDVDACAMESKVTAAAGGTSEPYPVRAGGQDAQFQVPPGEAPVDLLADEANVNAIEVIPGMILETLERPKKGHVVTAFIESAPHFKRSKATRIPIVLKKGDDEVKLDAIPEAGVRRLALKGKNPTVSFTYPYLSTGFLKLGLGDEGGLIGDGELTPSIPLLKNTKLKVHFGNGAFEGTLDATDPSKLRLPIPGFKVTRAGLNIRLAPDLALSGDVDFQVGKLLKGNLHAEPEKTGIFLKGTIWATIPKLEKAEGDVVYKNGDLTGSIHIQSEQLANLPGKPQGELWLKMSETGLSAEGKLSLTLPGGTPLEMEAKRATANQILLTGRTKFKIPGLEPVEVTIAYDGAHFSGEAKSGVTYKGISGTLNVKYWDGNFSGDTQVRFGAGRVAGGIHLFIDSDGDLYGDGDASVKITKDLTGKIGITKPKKGDVEVKGELALPPKIVLFKKKAIDKTIFEKAFNIPVFGPVAVQVKPSVKFSAGIGDASIDDAKVGAGFKPFAEDKDFELWASGQFSCPGFVTLSVGLGLGIALTAGVGSIGGGVDIIGSIGIKGGVFIPFSLRYKNGVFSATADVTVKGGLAVGVKIKGYLLAEVMGFELWHPEWDLWGKDFDTGLEFLLIVPLKYASDKDFQLPSVSDMTIKPDLDIDSLKAAVRDATGM